MATFPQQFIQGNASGQSTSPFAGFAPPQFTANALGGFGQPGQGQQPNLAMLPGQGFAGGQFGGAGVTPEQRNQLLSVANSQGLSGLLSGGQAPTFAGGQGPANTGGPAQQPFQGFIPQSFPQQTAPGFGPTGGGQGFGSGGFTPGQQTPGFLGTDPRGVAEQGFTNIGNRAEQLFQQGPQQFFPGQTVPRFTPLQQEGFGRAADAFRGGDELFQSGIRSAQGAFDPFGGGNLGAQTLAETARGDFLRPGTNPFSQAIFDEQIGPAIQRNVNQQFLGTGRFGSPTNVATLGRELGGAANDFFGGQFQQERQQQLQAGGSLANLGLQTQQGIPGLTGGAAQGGLGLLGLGQAQQQQRLAEINARRERFQFEQQAPSQQLAQFSNFINPLDLNRFPQSPNAPQSSRTQDILGTGSSLIGLAGGLASPFINDEGLFVNPFG